MNLVLTSTDESGRLHVHRDTCPKLHELRKECQQAVGFTVPSHFSMSAQDIEEVAAMAGKFLGYGTMETWMGSMDFGNCTPLGAFGNCTGKK